MLPTLDFTLLIHIGTNICIFSEITLKTSVFRETYQVCAIFYDSIKLYLKSNDLSTKITPSPHSSCAKSVRHANRLEEGAKGDSHLFSSCFCIHIVIR